MMVASLMAAAARTAPKGKGLDTIVTRVLAKGDCVQLSREMRLVEAKTGLKFFLRDAGNIEASDAVVLVGCRGTEHLGLNCGGCGFATCKEMADRFSSQDQDRCFQGPVCVIRMADLGIAIGSAVKTAQIHNVDNRIFFSAGVAALQAGLLPGCTTAYGIPLSISGKNIFFDRSA